MARRRVDPRRGIRGRPRRGAVRRPAPYTPSRGRFAGIEFRSRAAYRSALRARIHRAYRFGRPDEEGIFPYSYIVVLRVRMEDGSIRHYTAPTIISWEGALTNAEIQARVLTWVNEVLRKKYAVREIISTEIVRAYRS